MNLDYKVLKNLIVKSTKSERGSVKFIVNYDKLSRLTNEIGLRMVNVGTKSNQLSPSEVPYMAEYFKNRQLSWLNSNKHFTTLVFVQVDHIDDECEKLLDIMNASIIDDPDLDKVQALAKILAEYPCYCSTVVSYMGNDLNRYGLASYEVKSRANQATIRQEDYKYKHQDMR